jgi:hypothetical protein
MAPMYFRLGKTPARLHCFTIINPIAMQFSLRIIARAVKPGRNKIPKHYSSPVTGLSLGDALRTVKTGNGFAARYKNESSSCTSETGV